MICLCTIQKEKTFGKKSRSPQKPGKDHLWRGTEVSGTPPPKTCEVCVTKWLLTHECLMWDLQSWSPSLPRLISAWGNASWLERRYGKNHHRNRKDENQHCKVSFLSSLFVKWVRYMMGVCGLWNSFSIFKNINFIYMLNIQISIIHKTYTYRFNTHFTFVNSSCSAGY